MNGGSLVIKCLEELGVEFVFGYIGATIAPIFDCLISSKIKLITAVDEVGAAHMADGYARATGKVGVVLATSGPGATNLVTGIATAYMDSVPILAITANVPVSKLGKDSFQEVDITGIITPVTKYTAIVKSVFDLEAELVKGYGSAKSGRTAPVLIDITGNVFGEGCDFYGIKPTEKPLPSFADCDIEKAAMLIDASAKPIVLVGGGSKGAKSEILALSEKINAPIVSTMRSAGAIDSPLYLGNVGSMGIKRNNKIYRSADLVIAFGTRFSDRQHAYEGKNQKHIHVDIDKAELNKTVFADVPINAPCKQVACALISHVKGKDKWCVPPESAVKKSRTEKLAEVIASFASKEVIIATDVGEHQVAVLNAIKYIPADRLTTSAGLGTMGFGIGAAIGAYFGSGRPVLLTIGDGGFDMCFRELATAVKWGVALTVVIVNNRKLKMIETLQNKEYGGRHIAIDTPKISYGLLARGIGASYRKITLGGAEEAIASAIKSGKVNVLEFLTR